MMTEVKKDALKLVWTIIHNVAAFMLLAIIGLYAYEQEVVDFHSYTNIVSIVPTSDTFDSADEVGFFVFASSKHEAGKDDSRQLNVRKQMMCDDGTSDGYAPIAIGTSVIAYGELTKSLEAKMIVDRDNETLSYSQISGKLRRIAANGSANDYDSVSNKIIWVGELPTADAECFLKFDFSLNTKYFGLEKNYKAQSYPFDYKVSNNQ